MFCIRWPKDWSFSFSISPSNEYSGLISFKIDWFDLLAVQEILNCLLQHHSSKTSILRHSVLSTLYYTWTAAPQASQSITNSQSLLKLMSIKSVIPSNHLLPCRPLLLLPSVLPNIRVFSESVLRIRCPKYRSFSFSISPSNEYSGLMSFRTDWFDLLAVQETLKSLLQYHSLKASILQHSAFFIT